MGRRTIKKNKIRRKKAVRTGMLKNRQAANVKAKSLIDKVKDLI